MSYAIRNDGTLWRSVNSPDEVGTDEYFSEAAPSPSLKSKTDRMLGLIKAERDRRQLDGGAPLNGHWFLSNDRAVTEYNSVIAASEGLPADTVVRQAWRTMDGSTVDMTPALAKQILAAGFAQRCAIDDSYQAHFAEMKNSADPESYDYLTGWPKIYGE